MTQYSGGSEDSDLEPKRVHPEECIVEPEPCEGSTTDPVEEVETLSFLVQVVENLFIIVCEILAEQQTAELLLLESDLFVLLSSCSGGHADY